MGNRLLESVWIAFVILLTTSFYWWGRLQLGTLIFPVVILLVPLIGFLWLCFLSLRKSDCDQQLPVDYKTSACLLAAISIMLWGMFASILGTQDLKNSISVLAEMLVYCFLFLLITLTVKTKRGLKNITTALIVAVSLLAIEGLYHFFVTQSIWRLGAGDVHTYTNMGAFMYQAALILTLAKLLFDRGQPWYTALLFLGIALALTAALILSYSRGSWLTLVPVILLFSWRRKSFLVMATVLALVGLVAIPGAVTDRFVSAFSINSNSADLLGEARIVNTTELRLENIEGTLRDISKAPFIGRGIGFYHGEGESNITGERAPHNGYLRTWAEGGVVSAIGFIAFVLIITFSALRVLGGRKDRDWLLLGYCALALTHSIYLCLGDWLFQMYFWVFSGLAVSALRTLKPLGHEAGAI